MRTNLVWMVVAAAAIATPISAQDASVEAGLRVTRLVAQPAEVTLEAGSSTALSIRALDAAGNEVNAELRIRGRGVTYADGMVSASAGGNATLIVSVVLPADAVQQPVTLAVPITVAWPSVASIEVEALSESTLYAGTRVRYAAEAFFANGSRHEDPSFSWSTSDASVATIDSRGNITAHGAGSVAVTASFDGIRGTASIDVPTLPASTLARSKRSCPARVDRSRMRRSPGPWPSSRTTRSMLPEPPGS